MPPRSDPDPSRFSPSFRRLALLPLAAVVCSQCLAGCALFRKDENKEDEGLRRWDEGVEKPGMFERWGEWEEREADEMWLNFRDG